MPISTPICAKMRLVQDSQRPRKLGGPRYVCGKSRGHTGPHGAWRFVTQVEHAGLMLPLDPSPSH